MSDWTTPDEVKMHHNNGYDAGVAHERARILSILDTYVLDYIQTNNAHGAGAISHMRAIIGGPIQSSGSSLAELMDFVWCETCNTEKNSMGLCNTCDADKIEGLN